MEAEIQRRREATESATKRDLETRAQAKKELESLIADTSWKTRDLPAEKRESGVITVGTGGFALILACVTSEEGVPRLVGRLQSPAVADGRVWFETTAVISVTVGKQSKLFKTKTRDEKTVPPSGEQKPGEVQVVYEPFEQADFLKMILDSSGDLAVTLAHPMAGIDYTSQFLVPSIAGVAELLCKI